LTGIKEASSVLRYPCGGPEAKFCNRQAGLLKRVMASIFPGICCRTSCGTENNDLLWKDQIMNKNRYAKLMAVAAGFYFLCVTPGLTRAQSASPAPTQTHMVASSGSQMKMGSSASDDFAGLNYTDDQKTEIDRIHQETKAHQEAVAKDEKLNADQKDAMILGYTRLEYGQIYRQLTPEQKRQVQLKIRARRAEDEAAKRKQPPTQR
jgi:hypothetical protein